MRHIKSERLKKLEGELTDLEQWLRLGLVPKKDLDKHREEIKAVQSKIEEEKERLQFLKESGEAEEYITPKRPPATRGGGGYTEMPTIPDLDAAETGAGFTDGGFEMETDAMESGNSVIEEHEEPDEDAATNDQDDDDDKAEEDEESYFSDRNRWRRGGIIDPDADEW